MLAVDRNLLRAMRAAGLVVLCALAALLVAMASPSRADAARVRQAQAPAPRLLEDQTASFYRGAGFHIKPAR